MDIYVQNIAVTTETGYPMDLLKLKEKFINDAAYDKKRFPGLILKFMNPKSSFLIFHNGKVVCTGTKSVSNSETAAKNMFEKLRNAGFEATTEPKIVVQNIVCTSNLGFKIKLPDIIKYLPRSIYEPEQFPGIIHRVIDPKAVLLLFSSGRLVCTGITDEKDAARAVGQLKISLENAGLVNR